MITRRDLVVALGTGLVTLPFGLLAQEKPRGLRLGFLAARRRSDPPESDVFVEVTLGLSDLGYVEGRNLTIEWRFADGNYGRLQELASQLARIPVDLIVAADGTPATRAAQSATRTIPIVFINVGDPVGGGIVKSLRRPGGNTTWVSLILNDTSAKQIEMLSSVVPRLSRLACLANSGNPSSLSISRNLQSAAQAAGVSVHVVEARTEPEIEAAFSVMTKDRSDAFIFLPDSFLIQERHQIAALAAKNRLPGMGAFREYMEAGGLMSYGVNRADNYRRAATYIDKIFRGANPGDLPVEQPTKLELVINRRTAKALGLTIPPELLLLADRVIE